MPIFEFRCSDCGHVFESLRRNSEDTQSVACPKCRSQHVSRLISTFAVGRTMSVRSKSTCEVGSSCSLASEGCCTTCGLND